jgi:hypothetical protein
MTEDEHFLLRNSQPENSMMANPSNWATSILLRGTLSTNCCVEPCALRVTNQVLLHSYCKCKR